MGRIMHNTHERLMYLERVGAPSDSHEVMVPFAKESADVVGRLGDALDSHVVKPLCRSPVLPCMVREHTEPMRL